MKSRPKYFPNAFNCWGKRYYVAQRHPKASDDNPGAKQLPFKTISRAAAVVDMGDSVIIGAGVYREEIQLKRHGHQYVPTSIVKFMAGEGKKVWIKGSDVFDGRWEVMGQGVFKARLPEGLFKEGGYNPYALSCAVDDRRVVRPAKDDELPETLGQIYVNGQALEQVTRATDVEKQANTFVISADGWEIIAHCAGGQSPEGRLVELTMREKCFKALFSGPIFIQTEGIVVEHAAEPDPFCRCRPLTIRHNRGTGIVVRKTFNMPGNTERACTLMPDYPSYTSVKTPQMAGTIKDDTARGIPGHLMMIKVRSGDGGKTWVPVPGGRVPQSEVSGIGYFLDEDKDVLIRHFNRNLEGVNLDGIWKKENMVQYSRDGGRKWSAAEKIDDGKDYYRILKLRNGLILWPFAFMEKGNERVGTRIGKWRDDLSGIDWTNGGKIEVDLRESDCGLAEPSACQLDDGRIFVMLRAGAVLPAQGRAGVPSVKLYSLSEDDGRTWSAPQPLTYDDGNYVYSPRAMGQVVRASKNGRIYVILNITGEPTLGCDPRTSLNIAELDQKELYIRRATVSVIEEKLEGHHFLVRFSNFVNIVDRQTGHLILFMKLDMSEYCPVRSGYDRNMYRYEIKLPE